MKDENIDPWEGIIPERGVALKVIVVGFSVLVAFFVGAGFLRAWYVYGK